MFRAVTRPHRFIWVEDLSSCLSGDFCFYSFYSPLETWTFLFFFKGPLFFLQTTVCMQVLVKWTTASFSLPQQHSLITPTCQKRTWVFSTKLSVLLRIRASKKPKKTPTKNTDLTFWMLKSEAIAAPMQHPYLTCQGLSQLDYWLTMCSPTNLKVCVQPMWLFRLVAISKNRSSFTKKIK